MSAGNGALSIEKLTEDALKPVEARLAALEDELEPLIAEKEELAEFRARLTGVAPAPKAKPGKASSGGTSGRKTRRADEFLGIVHDFPGITIPQAAEKMGVAANYLYRIRNDALGAGTIRKEGGQFYPITVAEPDPARVRELEAASAASSS